MSNVSSLTKKGSRMLGYLLCHFSIAVEPDKYAYLAGTTLFWNTGLCES